MAEIKAIGTELVFLNHYYRCCCCYYYYHHYYIFQSMGASSLRRKSHREDNTKNSMHRVQQLTFLDVNFFFYQF